MGETRVSKIKDGDILEKAVKSKSGDEILPMGTELKKAYIELLVTLGVNTVFIKDREKSEKEEELYIEKCSERLTQIFEQHIYNGKNTLRPLESMAEDMISVTESWGDIILREEMYSNEYYHTIVVTIYSIIIARKLQVNKKDIREMVIGSLLHDIGVRYITTEYINRDQAEMSPQEVFEYKKHTIFGYTALENEDWVSEQAKNIVLSHHERIDGSGYPLKQKNAEMICRIVQAVDSFFCNISGIGCVARSKEEVLKEISSEAGIRYSREVIELIIDIMRGFT